MIRPSKILDTTDLDAEEAALRKEIEGLLEDSIMVLRLKPRTFLMLIGQKGYCKSIQRSRKPGKGGKWILEILFSRTIQATIPLWTKRSLQGLSSTQAALWAHMNTIFFSGSNFGVGFCGNTNKPLQDFIFSLNASRIFRVWCTPFEEGWNS